MGELCKRLLSCIKEAMQKSNFFGTYTLQGLLDQLDVIECLGRSGKDFRWAQSPIKDRISTTSSASMPLHRDEMAGIQALTANFLLI
jgi:hypothetical protein